VNLKEKAMPDREDWVVEAEVVLRRMSDTTDPKELARLNAVANFLMQRELVFQLNRLSMQISELRR
jgi:hypothetical protein